MFPLARLLFFSNVILATAPPEGHPSPSLGYPPRGQATPSPIFGGLGLRLAWRKNPTWRELEQFDIVKNQSGPRGLPGDPIRVTSLTWRKSGVI
jgi:hypothetical protein